MRRARTSRCWTAGRSRLRERCRRTGRAGRRRRRRAMSGCGPGYDADHTRTYVGVRRLPSPVGAGSARNVPESRHGLLPRSPSASSSSSARDVFRRRRRGLCRPCLLGGAPTCVIVGWKPSIRMRDRAPPLADARRRRAARGRERVGEGTSKGNSGHRHVRTLRPRRGAPQVPADPGLGGRLGPALHRARSTPFERIGTLDLALTADEEARLPAVLAEARARDVAAEIFVFGAEAQRTEALVAPDVGQRRCRVPGDGIIEPIRLAIGYADLAARDDADMRRSSACHGRAPRRRRDGARDDRRPGRRPLGGEPHRRLKTNTVAAIASGAALSSWPQATARHRCWTGGLDQPSARSFGGIQDEVRPAACTSRRPRSARYSSGQPHGTTRTAVTAAPTRTRSTGSWSAAAGWCDRSRPTGRSRCSRRTARPAIRSTAWSGTRRRDRPRGGDPLDRRLVPLRPSPSASATCSRRPGPGPRGPARRDAGAARRTALLGHPRPEELVAIDRATAR